MLAIVAACLAVVLIAVAVIGLRPKPAAAFVTQPVTQGALTQSVTATGTVNPVASLVDQCRPLLGATVGLTSKTPLSM